jgi:hypothetical protein
MSSIFSDPFFRRGSTLLGGETIEVDSSGNPVAGVEVVGQVKAFQDCLPTGLGTRHSNRLVYCVAARYKGATVNEASNTIAGKIFKFSDANSLTEIDAEADNANVDAGKAYGVVDEYLAGKVRTDDIIWVVVKGPAAVASDAGAGISAGEPVVVDTLTPGVANNSGGTKVIGQAIAAQTAGNTTRVNLVSDII